MSFLNKAYYLYRRQKWILYIHGLYKDLDISIDKPIFLIGTQGGGLTLVSRVLRRSSNVVSVTGNSDYWSGADEMQNVLGPILPPELTGIRHKVPYSGKFGTPRGWLYATDELIDKYRLTSVEATANLEEKLKKTIRWTIWRNRSDTEKCRFIDKSQVYTVRVSLINELLNNCSPHFVLVVRNPYALCYRAPIKAGSLSKIEDIAHERKIELAAQHWRNSIHFALKDRDHVENFKVIKFEDFLLSPKKITKKLCNFLELNFDSDMIPKSEHTIPFGSKYRNRWYPLRQSVNKKYLTEIEDDQVSVIEKYCGRLADKFGYDKPGPS